MCVFHLHTIEFRAQKESPRVRKRRKDTKTIKNHVDVLGRIYGQAHLLSSERSDNITENARLVNSFLRQYRIIRQEQILRKFGF